MSMASQTNPFSLAGKRILVTGASSGIGRSCALELSKMGARIVLVARSEIRLRETMEALHGSGHSFEIFDLLNTGDMSDWLKKITLEGGVLDGLVHSAGISSTLPIRATGVEEYRRILTINLESGFFLTKAFRQKGVRGSCASVVFIGSVMSLVGQPGLAVYAASKGGLVTLTKSLALELAKESIRVNLVAPGHVKTAMAETVEKIVPAEALRLIEQNHPLGLGRPEDVAYSVLYLLSDAAKWVTGSVLTVDGGYTAA